ncbi:repressor of RNA polymerase III transcription MAF1 homolog [Dendrobium catenatum]|uniref:repressor of RNA polymerase III transcription MAF1 homolog n=1 Tax=Dendrobium catenatum TaxID=906689 RepID=UPI0009F6B620|nr:repressor of RNA polymerase III transcription MAF1 homolog [Dendrobium catenatum]
MKFLEFTTLDSINLFLNDLNLGESTIKGSLEAYSCKPTSVDRRISDNLEHEILDYLSQSADSDPSSPVEYLSRRSSRRTLIYLVLTLGHMYPDYDFRAVQAHLFFTEEEWDSFRQIFDTYLFEAAKEWFQLNGGSLLECLEKAIDEVIKLEECEVYSYNPDFDGDPSIENGAIWSFHFFFYNKKLKRVLSFRCCCLSNLAIDGLPDEKMLEDEGVDDGLFIDMDM